jgi:hypothetical protein
MRLSLPCVYHCHALSDIKAQTSAISFDRLAIVVASKAGNIMDHESFRTTPARPEFRSASAGPLLLAATLLEILAMLHHPSVHTHDMTVAVQQIAAVSSLSAWVHGVLLALMLIIAFGLSEFALRRGFARPLIRAGVIAYAAGVLVMIGAALLSGFVVSGLMSLTPHLTPTDLQINAQLLTLCRVLNQSYANFGAVAMSAGIALWSLDLLRDAGAQRVMGYLGLALSLLPALALIFGLIHLDVEGMTHVLLLQAVWNIVIAVAMARSVI